MRYTTSEQSLYDWLCVSTGRALCDSGDAYGRNWQRNQKLSLADFKKQKCTIDVSAYDRKSEDGTIEHRAYINGADLPIFQFLRALMPELEIDTRCTKYMQWWSEHGDEDWELGDNGIFCPDEALEAAGLVATDGVVNTYNGESHLSQVIQYNTLYAKDNPDDLYLGISIHQGCDVRGGYTFGRIFKVKQYHTGTRIFLEATPMVSGSLGEYDVDVSSEIFFYKDGSNAFLSEEELYELIKSVLPDDTSSTSIEAYWDSSAEVMMVL